MAYSSNGDPNYSSSHAPYLLQECQQAKDAAYRERNLLVRHLTFLYPSCVGVHEGEDWEDDWRTVIYLDSPAGQLSWHVHDSEAALFEHLPSAKDCGVVWDGHTTDEKYNRLDVLGNAIMNAKSSAHAPLIHSGCGGELQHHKPDGIYEKTVYPQGYYWCDGCEKALTPIEVEDA